MAAIAPRPDSPSRHWPASLFRRPEGRLEQNLSVQELRDIVDRDEGALWVDMHPLGFYWALGTMFAVAAVMLWWLRSNTWL